MEKKGEGWNGWKLTDEGGGDRETGCWLAAFTAKRVGAVQLI
jgi:hypothetical protein